MLLFEETALKEEENDDKSLKEEGIKFMIFGKD